MSAILEVTSPDRDDQFQLTTACEDTCATPACDHKPDQQLTFELPGVARGMAVPFAEVAFCTVNCAREFFERLRRDDRDGYHCLAELCPARNRPTEIFVHPSPPRLVTVASDGLEHVQGFATTPRQFTPVAAELLTAAWVDVPAPLGEPPLEVSLEFAPHDEGFTIETTTIDTLDALDDALAAVHNPYVDTPTGPDYSRDWDRHDHPARLRIGDRLPTPADVPRRKRHPLRQARRALTTGDTASPTDLRLSVGPFTVAYDTLF
jgi:hypothetical protein